MVHDTPRFRYSVLQGGRGFLHAYVHKTQPSLWFAYAACVPAAKHFRETSERSFRLTPHRLPLVSPPGTCLARSSAAP